MSKKHFVYGLKQSWTEFYMKPHGTVNYNFPNFIFCHFFFVSSWLRVS